MLELGGVVALGVVQDDFADLEGPLLRESDQPRAEDVDRRTQKEPLGSLVERLRRAADRLFDEALRGAQLSRDLGGRKGKARREHVEDGDLIEE